MNARYVLASAAGLIPAEWSARSPFAGVDVCDAAHWEVAPGGRRPFFDEDLWDLRDVLEFPRSARSNVRRLDFTPITNPALRLTAKEYVFALMVPEHEVVIALPDARRTQYKPASVFNMTEQLVRWMNFVSEQGLDSLAEVLQEHCDAYKEIRSRRLPTSKRRGGPITEGTMLSVLLPVRGLATYREVFSRDAYRPGFVPWKGKSIAEVAGKKSQAHNSTPPVPEEVLQPTVAAALYLVETLGPVVAEEFETLLRTSMNGESKRPRTIGTWLRTALTAVVDRYVAQQIPLPRNETRHAARRVTRGWSPNDPLLRVDIGRLVNEAAHYTRIDDEQIEVVRPILEAAVAKVGTAGNFGRDAVQVPRADDEQTLVPWTLPLTGDEVRGLAFVVMAACRGLVAALSGMRASELEELTAASLLPPVTVSGGTKRYTLGSKLVKGQKLRGVEEKWVVLEPAYRAVQLAVRLNRAEGDDQAFARSQQDFLHQRLREWVNSPHGQRLGLAPIPPGPVNGRMLRRTTSLELAWRPGGLWAAKIQLKHLSVVASEGYAHYPGGAQATFLAEVERDQADHQLALTKQAYRDYRDGRMPAGPGARDLIEAFEHIDAELADHDAGTAAVLDTDRRLENLLRQQSKSLHLQAANYCWFRDPSRALCLKLAGTPGATKPLAGMCDSARCPQATHHPCHLPVWQATADSGKVFLDNPRIPKGERVRLVAEVERSQRVVNDIITADTGRGQV